VSRIIGGVRIDDLQGNALAAAGAAGLTVEYYRGTTAADFRMAFMANNATDIMYFTFQMSHRKKIGAPINSVHIHCIPMGDPASPLVVRFLTSYYWLPGVGEELPAMAGWTQDVESLLTVSPGDVFKEKIQGLVENIASPDGESYSSILCVKLARTGGSGGDTYNTNKSGGGTNAANLGVLYVDVHFPADRDGSVTEFND